MLSLTPAPTSDTLEPVNEEVTAAILGSISPDGTSRPSQVIPSVQRTLQVTRTAVLRSYWNLLNSGIVDRGTDGRLVLINDSKTQTAR